MKPPARSPGLLAELAYAVDELGSVGVAVQTNTDGTYLGHGRYAPLYEALNRRRAVVFAHPTSPPCAEQVSLGRPRPMPLLTDRMEPFYRAFHPDRTGPGVRQQAARLWFDMAGTPFPIQAPTLIEAFGSERLLRRR